MGWRAKEKIWKLRAVLWIISSHNHYNFLKRILGCHTSILPVISPAHWQALITSHVPSAGWGRRAHGCEDKRELRVQSCFQDFPDGPVVKTHLPMQGVQIWSMVQELGSHRPQGEAKNKNKIYILKGCFPFFFESWNGAISQLQNDHLIHGFLYFFPVGKTLPFSSQKEQNPQDPVHTEATVVGKEGGISGLAPHTVEVHGVWETRQRTQAACGARGTEWWGRGSAEQTGPGRSWEIWMAGRQRQRPSEGYFTLNPLVLAVSIEF